MPGWTDTAINRKEKRDRARLNGNPGAQLEPAAPRGAGAWTSQQVVEYMLTGIERGDFYIICPDNDVTSALDKKRIQWAAGDIVENRPPLSRWHPDYAAAFKKFVES